MTVVTDTTSLDLTNASGPEAAGTLQAGQNAIVVIGEPDQTTISIERESNVISDAIPDVTLTLKSKTVTTPNTGTGHGQCHHRPEASKQYRGSGERFTTIL